MISKKFLGIFGLVVLAVVLLPLISAPCSCFSDCISAQHLGVASDTCGQCYSPSVSSCAFPTVSGCTCSCVADNTESCSLTCTLNDACPSSPAFNVYTDYAQGIYDSYCLGGICQGSCPVTATGICDISKVCNNVWEYCGGTQLTCVNVSSLKYPAPYQRWVSTIPGEIDAVDCSDGIDNDCDDLFDCNDPDCSAFCSSSKLKFRKGTTSTYAAVIGSNGAMDINGSLTPNVLGTITASGNNNFLIKDSSGNIVVKLDYSGNLFLKGSLNQGTPDLSGYLTDAGKQFIVKNSAGTVVAVFDQSGNLSLAGALRQLQIPQ